MQLAGATVNKGANYYQISIWVYDPDKSSAAHLIALNDYRRKSMASVVDTLRLIQYMWCRDTFIT